MTPSERRHRPPSRRILTGVLLITFASFVLIALAGAFAEGVWCADDAFHAMVAKNLARGLGYTSTVSQYPALDTTRTFDEDITIGPTLVVPLALAIRVAGNRYWLPGTVAVVCWAALMIAVFRSFKRLVRQGSVELAGIVFLATAYGVTVLHCEQWSAFLGEVPAFLFVLLGTAVWARRPSSPRRIFLASLCMSLAMLTKLLAVLYSAGFLLVLVVVLARSGRILRRRSMVALAAGGAGLLLPLAAFQGWKLAALGAAAYWNRIAALAGKVAQLGVAGRLSARLPYRVTEYSQSLFHRFGLSVPVLVILSVAAFLLILSSRRSHLIVGSAVLLAGFFLQLSWWLLVSPGRPRHLLIAVLVALALIALPLAVESRPSRKIVLIVAAAVIVLPNADRLARPVSLASQNGWFQPSDATVNALKVKAMLDGELAGRRCLGQWWATVADLEYLSSGVGRFESYRVLDRAAPGRPRILAVNTRFVAPDDKPFAQVLQSCQLLADLPPYLMMRCESAPSH